MPQVKARKMKEGWIQDLAREVAGVATHTARVAVLSISQHLPHPTHQCRKTRSIWEFIEVPKQQARCVRCEFSHSTQSPPPPITGTGKVNLLLKPAAVADFPAKPSACRAWLDWAGEDLKLLLLLQQKEKLQHNHKSGEQGREGRGNGTCL